MNIPDTSEKIKAFLDVFLAEWGLFLIVILVAVAAFGLGRFSALEAARPLIQLSEAPQQAVLKPLTQGGMVVASRTGETYYFPWCSGAGKIAPANQRVFASSLDAKRAGLRPAKTCKGLD